MSRVGKLPIKLPKGVTIKGPADNIAHVEATGSADNIIYVKGPKGELSEYIDPAITVTIQNDEVVVHRRTNQKRHKSLHGLYRVLINNMITGVTVGFTRSLELVGVGYKANLQGNILDLDLGYSHKIYFTIPSEIKVQAEIAKSKNPLVHLEGIDKQLLGQVAAKLKSLRKVEPYKGKGIRYLGEPVRHKEGKTASK